MDLLDILACPRCRGGLDEGPAGLRCRVCGAVHPVEDGVPVLMRDRERVVEHEGALPVHEGYLPAIRQLIDALPADEPVLDVGAGNRDVDDDRVVRMDVLRTPHVDVVGDAHALPFADESFAFVHATAVFEHLRQPFVAAREIMRVLKPGGQLIVDCAFVFPFHGYPATYFNASAEGLRELFEGCEEIFAGVSPWQAPSYALKALIGEYLRLFRPGSQIEREFVVAVRELERFPVRDFDQRFTQEEALRISACVTYVAMKPARGRSIVPGPILQAHARREDLQERYPSPHVFLKEVRPDEADSLLVWARTEGRCEDPAVARCLDERPPFRKWRGLRDRGPGQGASPLPA